MILHGVYDHGKIIIDEKEKPDICSKVEIIFLDESPELTEKFIQKELKLNSVAIKTRKWKFNREEIYSDNE